MLRKLVVHVTLHQREVVLHEHTEDFYWSCGFQHGFQEAEVWEVFSVDPRYMAGYEEGKQKKSSYVKVLT